MLFKEVEDMHLSKNVKAVSTLSLIIIIFFSIIFGALISYLWVMGNFYLTPEDSTNLAITNVDFPVDHANYFNLSVMNPSNSAYGTDISNIYFTVENNNTIFNVDSTVPSLPIPLKVGTEKSVVCNKTWSAFAGQTITVHVITNNATGATYTYQTRLVKLEVDAYFLSAESINYFNVTVKNSADSAINLTLSEVYFEYNLVQNKTLALPKNITIGETVNFRCYANWRGKTKPYIYVKTLEGYIADIRKDVVSVVNMQVANVTFNLESPVVVNITVSNLPDSTVPYVDITEVTITYENGTKYPIMGMLTNPSFYPYYRLEKDKNVTFTNCVWPWVYYRDRDFMVVVQTRQGFNASRIWKSPQSLLFKLEEVSFNLNNTGTFSFTLWNMPASTQNATVSEIEFVHGTNAIKINETSPSLPYTIAIVAKPKINCTLDWSSYKGENITIKIYTAEKVNLTIPYILPIVAVSANFNNNTSTQYFSLAIQNKAYLPVSITGINVNGTDVNATLTYPKLPSTVEYAKTVQILCPLDWQPLSGKNIIITVATSAGFNVTITVKVP